MMCTNRGMNVLLFDENNVPRRIYHAVSPLFYHVRKHGFPRVFNELHASSNYFWRVIRGDLSPPPPLSLSKNKEKTQKQESPEFRIQVSPRRNESLFSTNAKKGRGTKDQELDPRSLERTRILKGQPVSFNFRETKLNPRDGVGGAARFSLHWLEPESSPLRAICPPRDDVSIRLSAHLSLVVRWRGIGELSTLSAPVYNARRAAIAFRGCMHAA